MLKIEAVMVLEGDLAAFNKERMVFYEHDSFCIITCYKTWLHVRMVTGDMTGMEMTLWQWKKRDCPLGNVTKLDLETSVIQPSKRFHSHT